MKKLISIIFILLLAHPANAQVTKSIDISTPGTLSDLLTADEKATITNLTVTGNLDARDFTCMRDEITNLSVLDISTISIKYYKGFKGPQQGYDITYPANGLPVYSFYNTETGKAKNLTSINLPTSLNLIGSSAFLSNKGLTQITIPEKVISIQRLAFFGCENINSLIIPNSVNLIEESAFSSWRNLTTLTLGNGLLSIGSNAFSSCGQLTTIYSSSYPAPVLGAQCFNSNTLKSKLTIYVSSQAYTSYQSTSGWYGPFINNVMVDDGTYIKVIIGGSGIVKENNVILYDNSHVSVTFPDRKTFTLVPNAGYEIAAVRYNGTDVKSQVTGNKFISPIAVKIDTLDVSFIKSTGTPELTDNRVKVYAAHSVIHVEGTTAGEPISLYTAQGQQLQAIKSQGERTMLNAKQAGIYLVKVESKTFKVVCP